MTWGIEVAGVRVGYDAAPVLDGVSLRVGVGEWVSILGPNGSGKTTLLRTIGAFLRPAAGEVRVQGRPASAYARKELARRLAAVGVDLPQDFPFTVAEFVLLGRTPHLGEWQREGPEDWRLVAEALERTGARELADRPMARLSSGERQKAVLARALAQQPSVLLLDEPTIHLDICRQVEMMDLLAELRRDLGMTIVAVLHDLNLAALYSDRLILLAGGRVVAAGAPDEVLTEEHLREVYGCRVLVERHPVCGVPQVLVLPRRAGGRFDGAS